MISHAEAGQQNSEIWAVIPARGGSKGIPRKNVRVLGGLPLLAHSIRHAQNAPAVTRVLVSTDDAEIAETAAAYGAEVVWRPDELSGDTASSESALLHALDSAAAKYGCGPEYVVFLQATSPLRETLDVQRAIEQIREETADSLFSGCPVEGFTWRRGTDLLAPINYDPEHRPRRQDLQEEVWEENGSIYVFKPAVLRQKGSRLGGKIAVYPMTRENSFQLDVPEDVALLNTLFEARERARGERTQSAAHAEERTAVLAGIQLLVFDFDGVMTDNRVLVDETGREAALCHRGDGWGIARLRETGLEMLVLSTEVVPIVEVRCTKLKIKCIHACDDKITALKELAHERGLTARQIAYVGNDVNDADCLRWAGCPIVVADAEPEVLPLARFTATRCGGAGAVREIADWFIAARAHPGGQPNLDANKPGDNI